MRYNIILLSVIGSMILYGCGAGKQLTQNREAAEANFNSGNYISALAEYKMVIEVYETNNNETECQEYTNAGISALKTNDAKLAVSYLKKAMNTRFADQNTYYFLAKAYKDIDNLSLELVTLTGYVELFPEGEKIDEVKNRLFYTYIESENFDNALELWPDIYNGNNEDIELLEAYFVINKEVDNVEICNETADKLLGIDESNITALTWFGKQYYRKAEDRYREEMKAYEKNRTNKQYRKLLKALDEVTIDFKTSLKYFEKLYKIEPTPENANYLGHIYGRLSDKKKSEYYKKLAKKTE